MMKEMQWESHFGRNKVETEKDLFPELAKVKVESQQGIDKKYSERKTELESWPGQSIYINERLSGWLKFIKYNQNIQTSEERSTLLKQIDSDAVFRDYLSSKEYAERNIKRKTSWQSEDDMLYSKKIDWIGNHILWPNAKEYGIETRNQKRNVGRRKADEDGYRESFIRTFNFSDVTNPEGEIWESYNARNFMNKSTGTMYERLMTESEPLYSSDMHRVDLGNIEHIKILLERYNEWWQLLVEQDQLDSEMGNLLMLLEDLIYKCNFSVQELYLIDLIKTGEYTYKKMEHCINLTYRQIEHKCRKSIPNRIVKQYIKMFGKKSEEIVQNKPKPIVLTNLIDSARFKHNKKIKERYNTYSKNGKVYTYKI